MPENDEDTLGNYRVREAVGAFPDLASMEKAVDELEIAGFDRAAVSVLALEPRHGERLTKLYRTLREIEDDGRAPRQAFVSSDARTEGETMAVAGPFYVGGVAGAAAVATAGGALALAFAGAIVTGAAAAGLGAILAGAIARRHATGVEEQLKKGGLILWVDVGDDADAERRAVSILEMAGARDIHVHEIEREVNLRDLPLANVQPDPFLERSDVD